MEEDILTMGVNGRTSFDEAVRNIVGVLKPGNGMNIAQVARAADVSSRTAKKVLTLLLDICEEFDGMKITEHNTGPTRTYIMVEKAGLEKVSKEIRDMYVRGKFPEATLEQRCLVGLLLNGATSRERTARIEDSKLGKRLLKLKRVAVNNGGFYLSDFGLSVARGTLKTYPELVEHAYVTNECFTI